MKAEIVRSQGLSGVGAMATKSYDIHNESCIGANELRSPYSESFKNVVVNRWLFWGVACWVICSRLYSRSNGA